MCLCEPERDVSEPEMLLHTCASHKSCRSSPSSISVQGVERMNDLHASCNTSERPALTDLAKMAARERAPFAGKAVDFIQEDDAARDVVCSLEHG